ncbi:MAG: hypothetical protein ABMB14_21640, partial [Myxococcota bacterium]
RTAARTAAPSEAPLGATAGVPSAPAPEPLGSSFPPRHTNPGFGFGAAYLNAGATVRPGVALELRREIALSRSFQFDLTLSAGLTTPQNTAAVIGWGTQLGGSITDAFGDVHDWAREPPARGLRHFGALFAYFGLGLSYVAVPVTWIVSPVASAGHAVAGPTISWHTGPEAPNLYLELGAGGTLYGDPAHGGPQVGVGPMVGAGAQIGRQTVGARVLACPSTLHTGTGTDTVWTGAVVVGL